MSIDRIRHAGLREKVMSAEAAAEFVKNGMNLAITGFTGAGYPKALPTAIANKAKALHAQGEKFSIGMVTGASTAPECDGVLAEANAVHFRSPFQSDPTLRNGINAGNIAYQDMHLSHVEQQMRQGFYGKFDIAIVEATAITENGELVFAMGIGHGAEAVKNADKVIIEINEALAEGLEGMHDIYADVGLPPHRKPIPIVGAFDRIGTPALALDPNKVVAIVLTNGGDRNSKFAEPDDVSKRIAAQVIDFLDHEVKAGRLPKSLLPLQSGVGNVANAVMAGLLDAPFEDLTGYTEVLQDGMLDLILAKKMKTASATALSFSPDALQRFNENIEFLKDKIILRPMEISNNPEIIRRLGVIGMNSMIEADIYGNVNSTHVMGTRMMNGIGGSGDFTRNGFFSFYVSPSTAKGGAISAIVPMVSHHDHTEHDVMFIVTEQGMADLRGKAPKDRAKLIIENCSHPDYRDMLRDYYDRALVASQKAGGIHTPHILLEALSWHQRFVETGDMRIK
ncbi:propionyl-CoA--succinate CoA transferase [Moraxella caviae]|uniref:Propionyl-CoA--succinate CoA transferase n=1 Tax=Moraxella caviae TaxID=34060 RepID=A0A1T0A5V0_9GAMM|nr:acetyl-CoA hydrolase/transferase family protein [Moraxella caviae]OOR91050.1 propionyl-CoA--succinate CoA transferase [Moraxella caviae]STZ14259.1 Propionyl-CoA:succinate CoA transferase [Moraxella caviae]VEW12918.1 Propionyl-CoA:succinate CoA transferase [Moraxella caviae]